MDYYKKLVKVYFVLIIGIYALLNIAYYIINPYFYYDNNFFPKFKTGYHPVYAVKLAEKLKNENYTLVFGTSRSLSIDNEIIQDDVINLFSVYGHPQNIETFLNYLDKDQVRNINKIYYLLDTHTFYEKLYYVSFDYDYFIKNFIHLVTYEDFKHVKMLFDDYRVSEFGYRINKDKVKNSIISAHKNDKTKILNEYSNENILSLGRIIEFCNSNNIELVLFTPTFSKDRLKNIDIEFYHKQLSKLFSIKDINFYNLIYDDNVSEIINGDRYKYFSDNTHLNYIGMEYIFNNHIHARDKNYLITNQEELDIYFDNLKKKLAN